MASRAESRKRWGAIINEWRASGESMAAFCRERRLDYRRLQRWGRRLGSAPGSKPLTLIPVVAQTSRRAGSAAPVVQANCVGAAAVRIRLPGDISVDVQEGFDPGVLLRVVELLRGAMRC